LRCAVVEGRVDFRLNIGLNVDKPASNPEITRDIRVFERLLGAGNSGAD
jgi:hypothetical protein